MCFWDLLLQLPNVIWQNVTRNAQIAQQVQKSSVLVKRPRCGEAKRRPNWSQKLLCGHLRPKLSARLVGPCASSEATRKRMRFVGAVFLTVVWMLASGGEGGRILAVFPFPSRSHAIVLEALAAALAARGHELVVVSSFPDAAKHNYTDVDLMPDFAGSIFTQHSFSRFEMNAFQQAVAVWNKGLGMTETVAASEAFHRVLQDEKGFDLVIVEQFLNEGLYGLAYHFKAPLVLLCSFGGFHWHNYALANPTPLSYYPNPLLEYTHKMTFTERLTNVVMTTLWDLGHFYYYLPRHDTISKTLFGPETPHVLELESRAAVVLVNQHFSLNYPRPLLPNVIEVGGMHVSRSEVRPLPDELRLFLDGAEHGVVYFSMGSNLRSEQMGETRVKAFVDAFAQLKQRVLWKWEADSLPATLTHPPNLKLAKWLPQQQILAHPGVDVFITHGGLLSAQEAALHGVVLVGIPIFGDQMLNMKKAQHGGFGILLDFNNVTKESVLWALNEALSTQD
ncbi:Hypothetical predicted protein [Cloeon dipterum]|uniref:Glucuronosyltransferase n=1 Tax=Cloeon dipterum TaxID=197152 RepID=A0A8S1D7S9_9INSE|nr:Hypothetical predicted protein [Cloeon dipterum]